MANIAVCDLTGLLMNEPEYLVEELGMQEQYDRMCESEKIDLAAMEKCLQYVFGKKTRGEVCRLIGKAEPFGGSRETVNCLKRKGYWTVVVTDDALTSLSEINETVKRKLGVGRIIPTAEIIFDNGTTAGLKNIRSKPLILQEVLKEYPPENLLCMVQGLNDYGLAVAAKGCGGTVISVNSHSPKLEGASDYHIESIAEAPGLLEEILKIDGNRLSTYGKG